MRVAVVTGARSGSGRTIALRLAETGCAVLVNDTDETGGNKTVRLIGTDRSPADILTKVMALALAPYNIDVNAILSGTMETDVNRRILRGPSVGDRIAEVTPLKSLGLLEHIA